MRNTRIPALLAIVLFAWTASQEFAVHAGADPQSTPLRRIILQEHRASASDLEIGGDLAGVPPNSTRYVTLAQLNALPQITFAVTGDSNFTGPTRISGVSLRELSRQLAANPEADFVVAICDDKYHAYYSRAYISAHQPVLALEINGKPSSGWPKDPGGKGFDMGPFLISHPHFTPSHKTLSHLEEPQIPWGVVRLDFRNEKQVFAAIEPRRAPPGDLSVENGFALAKQNCFRCHNSGDEGGQKAGISWPAIAAIASASPEFLAAYVRDPQSINKSAQMEASPDYDDDAMRALIAYFSTFSGAASR
jgi:mono/diheme cytochrome c family protein